MLTNQMQFNYKRTQDSKLGYIHKQLSMYGYMLQQLFGFKSVHAVAVFCSKLGFAEFEFKLACNKEIMQWVSEYNDDTSTIASTGCTMLSSVVRAGRLRVCVFIIITSKS